MASTVAARRLIIILLVLLGISSLTALLASPIEQRNEQPVDDRTSSTDAVKASGAVLDNELQAFGRPLSITASAGDRLSLAVKSTEPTAISIPGLGLSGYAAPGAPATFDLILYRPGRYAIRRGDDTKIGEVTVGNVTGPAKPGSGGGPGGGGSGSSNGPNSGGGAGSGGNEPSGGGNGGDDPTPDPTDPGNAATTA